MRKLLYILCLAMLAACVTEYEFKQEVASDVLVVEGYITDLPGESKITISKSIPFDDAYKNVYVEDATISVLEKNGTTHHFISQNNSYRPIDEDFTAMPNTEYKLSIEHENDLYESEWVPFEKSSDIEEINWDTKDVYQAGVGEYRALQVKVTTIEDANTSRFYRYQFEETWLNIAGSSQNKEYETHFIYSNSGEPLDFEYKEIKYDNITYCWPTTVPGGIYITSSTGLSENKIIEAPVYNLNISSHGRKLLHKYSLLIKQFAISDDVYHTYSTMKQFSESDVTLFATQPGFVEGNIQCISDNSKRILGVFHVSEIKKERIFILYRDLSVNDRLVVSKFSKGCSPKSFILSYNYCPGDKIIKAIRDTMKMGYEINNVLPDDEFDFWTISLSTTPCMDCRTEGTNIMPDWWGEIME